MFGVRGLSKPSGNRLMHRVEFIAGEERLPGARQNGFGINNRIGVRRPNTRRFRGLKLRLFQNLDAQEAHVVRKFSSWRCRAEFANQLIE